MPVCVAVGMVTITQLDHRIWYETVMLDDFKIILIESDNDKPQAGEHAFIS